MVGEASLTGCSRELDEPPQNPFAAQQASSHRKQDAIEPPLERPVGGASLVFTAGAIRNAGGQQLRVGGCPRLRGKKA